MLKHSTLISVVFIFSFLFAEAAEQPIFRSEFINEKNSEWPYAHASTLESLPNGDLLVAWYAGTREKASDVAVLYSRFRSHMPTWTTPEVLVYSPTHSQGNPVLYLDVQNRLWLFFVTMYGDNDWTTCKIRYRCSDDNGWTWGSPYVLREEWGWMPRCRPLPLKNGEIVLPLYDEVNGRSVFMISSNGRTQWRNSGQVVTTPGNEQPALVQYPDGEIVSLMRTRATEKGRIWLARSFDDSRTWTSAEETELPNPDAAVSALLLQEGPLLLIFNDSETNRTKLTLAVSQDRGKSWNRVTDLENQPGEYSYPEAIQTPDGLIHVTYSYKPDRIKHVVFNYTWLKNQP
ncbi:MAG: hypothetical protein C4527_14105 [Candidatus Omnitrophota bacterium]|jgi:predicted neuraminidase|nr:MAG: hypothetical protein C4527_14105 [Candidatus Omnitrophota bacterium]